MYVYVFCHDGVNAPLTVSLGTDETGGCAVKEGKKAGHSQADVGIRWSQVQGCEAWKLHLQDVLWSHFDIWYLHREVIGSFITI